MNFLEALEELIRNYNYANKCGWIKDPVAWALYKTWCKVETKNKEEK